MPWTQFTLHGSAKNAEWIAELMQQCGAQAVTFGDAADQPLFEPAPGTTPLWQQTTVTGLFQAGADLTPLLLQLSQHFPDGLPPHSTQQLDDQDWERTCLDRFQPMRYGQRLWVVPSWRKPPDPTAVNVLLDPGLAFGTGTHATTALCLEWLEQHPVQGMEVLDFGCGSGILAIAAIKLGAKHAAAIDIDPQALIATEANAELNHCKDKLSLYTPENLPQQQRFSLILANILAAPLQELADTLAEKLVANGQIVLSGILRDQAQAICDRYSHQFDLQPIAYKEDWVRICGIRRQIP